MAASTLAVSFAAAVPAHGYNAVPAGNGTTWDVHDAAAPGPTAAGSVTRRVTLR